MISLIIPTMNAEKFISKSIESFLKQDIKQKYEIIVVDSSSDKTTEILSKYPVKIIKQKKLGPAAARNSGVKKAKGDIVVFVDGDCVAPKTWLRKLVNPFSDGSVAAVAGIYKIWNKESSIARFSQYEIEQRYEKMKNATNIDFVGSYNCAYRKSVFTKFGGFDEKMIQGEDPDLSFRISKNHKIVFEPSAYVYHKHVSDLITFSKRKFQRAYWKAFLYKRHKGKVLKNVYTPANLMPQTFFFALSLISLLLSPFNMSFFYLGILLMFLSYLLNYHLINYIWKKESGLLATSFVLIFIRNLFSSLGLTYGIMHLLRS
jgi:cellulose synthase/poly-beta-1,6-N-acetylglucosamine synthase-like glycosyltransferase